MGVVFNVVAVSVEQLLWTDLLLLIVGDIADLIFVFFDPIGQALCKRTLSLVENLNEKHADRMRFYLSKADEAGHEGDRQVTVSQVTFESLLKCIHVTCPGREERENDDISNISSSNGKKLVSIR